MDLSATGINGYNKKGVGFMVCLVFEDPGGVVVDSHV